MDINKKKLPSSKELICNVCGKKVLMEQGVFKEDMFEVAKEWGYFSKYDFEIHKFNICEECYDKMVSNFKIPIKSIKKREVL